LASLSGAYLDVLVDALMVIQSRIDEEDGSEQLQSLSWGAMGAGGMIGSLLGGYLTEYQHPKWSFLSYSILGLIVMLLGIRLDKSAEKDPDAQEEEPTGGFLIEFKKSMAQIKQAIKMPEIYMTLLFFIIYGLICPSFGEFWYFFQLEVIKFTKF
jgi:MFS family permease